MRGIKHSCLFILALCAYTGTQAQERRLKMTPERPSIGDTVKLLYRPDTALLKTGKPILGAVYIYDTTYHWTAQDLPLKKTDSGYTATVPLTPDKGLWAFKFRAGDSTDNNRDTGYIIMGSVPGRQWKAAYAGYGALRARDYEMGIRGYYKNFSIGDSAMFFWMGQEIGYWKAGRTFIWPYVRARAAMERQAGMNPENSSSIQSAASYMLHAPNLSEKDLFTLALINEQYLHKKERADSLRAAINAQYPNGILKKLADYKELIKERDTDKKLSLSEQFIKTYAPEKELDDLAGIEYDRGVWRNIFAISIAKGDTGVLAKYINTTTLNQLAFAYYKMVEIPYADWKSMPAKVAYPFSKRIIDKLADLKSHKPEEYYYYTPAEFATYVDGIFKTDYITHIAILSETGREKEALALALRMQETFQYSNATLNQLEASLLEKAGDKKRLDEVLRNSVRMNQASAQIIDLLKKDYLKTHKDTEGFDAYLNGMKDAHTMELLREHVKSAMIDRAAVPFEMKDLDGNTVSLAAQKGKVVVMDFWATWCAPCKAAMPGMQMAQEHFKNDSNVVFYFVDTQERDPEYKEKVKKFIKEKKYPFKVLFDNGDEFYSKYAKLIQTSGIPFKVVIDGNGKIRFAQTGYMGSPSGLADEIEMMISLAK
ncbi:TlpA disulfide reductase family protein [Chitinophaga sp.]|uniref:TlpA family protein disulfide reductase n=1 Tax=Chitinophaga sp. TaxID=1869181 RepID=UPI0031D1711B